MRRRSLFVRLPLVLGGALVRAAARPGVVVLFLLLNLGLALVVAMPVRSLLSAELDDNLYGDAMATGTSWRWFDTVEREHPQAVGNAAPWTALFSDRGIRLADLAAVSGPPAALLVAGLLLFLLTGPLHVGYLATRRGGDRGPPPVDSTDGNAKDSAHDPAAAGRGPRAVLAAAATYWLPGVVLGALAAACYAAVYAAVYAAPATALGRLAELLQSERWHLAEVWLRLALTLGLLLVVKAFFDLAKLGVAVRRRRWGVAAGLALAAGELWRRGWAYVGVDLVLGLGTLLLGAVWWVVSGPLVAQTWLGLAILFVLHQAALALRIVLRLAHLDGAAAIYTLAHPAAPPAPPPPAEEAAGPATETFGDDTLILDEEPLSPESPSEPGDGPEEGSGAEPEDEPEDVPEDVPEAGGGTTPPPSPPPG